MRCTLVLALACQTGVHAPSLSGLELNRPCCVSTGRCAQSFVLVARWFAPQKACVAGAQAKLEGQQRKRPKHAASTHAPPAGLRPPGASSQAEQPTLRNAEPAQPSAADPPAQPAGGAAEPSSSEPAEGLGPEVCGTSGGDLEERSAGTSAGGPANKLASGHEQVANQQIRRREGKASRADAQRTGNSKQGLGVGSGSGQDPWQPDGGTAAPGAAFAPKSGLKQRKKDFLNRRKLKKRGRAVSEAEAGDRLERRLLQDPQRPASGEQALAPLKVRDTLLTFHKV